MSRQRNRITFDDLLAGVEDWDKLGRQLEGGVAIRPHRAPDAAPAARRGNAQSKLSDDDVRWALRQDARGVERETIAEHLDVSTRTVVRICEGRTYRHVWAVHEE